MKRQKKSPLPAGTLLDQQRQWTDALSNEINDLLGDTSGPIRRYEASFRKEWKKLSTTIKPAKKDALMRKVSDSDVVLVGDFHSDPQSQKTVLRVLRALSKKDRKRVTLGFEMLQDEHQGALNSYLGGKISERRFLKAIDYEERWGYSWSNLRPLFEFARSEQIPIIGLWPPSRKTSKQRKPTSDEPLLERDEWAGERITQARALAPDRLLIVLFGELHLSQGHLPKAIDRHSKKRGLKTPQVLRIFQNQDDLYFGLSSLHSPVQRSIFSIGKTDYFVIAGTPWNRKRSLLRWIWSEKLLEQDSEDGELHEFFELVRNQGLLLQSLLGIPGEVSWDSMAIEPSHAEERLRLGWRLRGDAFDVDEFNENTAAEIAAFLLLKETRPRIRFVARKLSSLIFYRTFSLLAVLILNPKKKLDFPKDHADRLASLMKRARTRSEKKELAARRLYLFWSRRPRDLFAVGEVAKILDPFTEIELFEIYQLLAKYIGSDLAFHLGEAMHAGELTLQELRSIFEINEKRPDAISPFTAMLGYRDLRRVRHQSRREQL